MKKLYLLDCHWLFWRSYHAPFRNLSIPCQCTERMQEPAEDCPDCGGTGQFSTKAVYQMVKDLLKLVREQKPEYIAAVFDGKRSALRRRLIYPEYKANRGDGTEQAYDVRPQLRLIKRIFKALGIQVVQCEGYEADDAIATLATRFASPKRKVVIISRDKDLMYLTRDPNVVLFDSMSGIWYDAKRVKEKFGIPPRLIPDFLALQGDKADNIPNVPGWGEKKTAEWLRVYKGGTDMLLKAARMGSLPVALGRSLIEADKAGTLGIARKLVELDTNVKLYLRDVDLRVPVPFSLRKANAYFRAFQFQSLLDKEGYR